MVMCGHGLRPHVGVTRHDAQGGALTDLAAALAALEQGVHELEPAQVPGFVTRLGALLALAGARLASQSGQLAEPDRLVKIDEAASLLGMSKDWLYRNATRLPFTRRHRRALRFSEAGIRRYVATGRP